MLTFCQVEILLCRGLPRAQAMPGAEGPRGTVVAIGPSGTLGHRGHLYCLGLLELWVREVCRGRPLGIEGPTGSPLLPGPPDLFVQKGDGGSPGKPGPPGLWSRIGDKGPLGNAGPTGMPEMTISGKFLMPIELFNQLNCGEEGVNYKCVPKWS